MNFKKRLQEHQETINELMRDVDQLNVIESMAEICQEALQKGCKIMLCGNGGSAADSQHIAAEFVGRFVRERQGLPAIALTTDTSILTAISNDYGYEEVFRRQVEALGQKGDVLIGISTSGNSGNIVRAFEQAIKQEITTMAFTGLKESRMSALADVTLRVPATVTARVQECHIIVGHMICEALDEDY